MDRFRERLRHVPQWVLWLLVLLLLVANFFLNREMRPLAEVAATGKLPLGIVSWELAGTPARHQVILDAWSENQKEAVRALQDWDNWLPVAYGGLSLVLVVLAWRASERPGWNRVGSAALAGAVVAPGLDLLENRQLNLILRDGPTEFLTVSAAVLAGLKFLLLLGLSGYLLAALVAVAVPRRVTIKRWMRLLMLRRYSLLLGPLYALMPLTVFPGFPGHAMLGNLYSELSEWQLAFAVFGFLLVPWALMFPQSMVVAGADIRLGHERSDDDDERARDLDELLGPFWRRITMPISWGTFRWYTAAGGPGIVAVVALSDAPWVARVGWATFGVLIAVTGLLLVTVPARMVDPDFEPLPPSFPGTAWLRQFQRSRTWPARAVRGLVTPARSAFDWVMGYYFPALLRPRHASNHFMAVTSVVVTVGFLLVVLWFFAPGQPTEASAVFYVAVLLTLLVWVVLFFDLHLGRFGLPPVLTLIGCIALLGAPIQRAHTFDLVDTSARGVDIVTAAATARETLVVVAATGGGISAAGWTTEILRRLEVEAPGFAESLKLVAGVSGGAVGAAHYVDGKLRERTPRDIRERSVDSSLAAAAYGLAYPDFFRLVSGGILPWSHVDRGLLLEQSWRRTVARSGALPARTDPGRLAREGQRALYDMGPAIEAGDIPGVIFGATVLESGRRVMLTPFRFEGDCRRPATTSGVTDRACTLWEYLGVTERLDIDLFTAARLSATFPWVSPAASPRWSTVEPSFRDDAGRHHLIDGGYYDNYAVSSALDWLSPVLEARVDGDRLDHIRRVLIVQIRPSSPSPPACEAPRNGPVSALVEPLTGLLRIRRATAVERNRIDLEAFEAHWEARVVPEPEDNELGLEIETVVFQPDAAVTSPLSWHLTTRQKSALWQSTNTAANRQRIAFVREFLAGRRVSPVDERPAACPA